METTLLVTEKGKTTLCKFFILVEPNLEKEKDGCSVILKIPFESSEKAEHFLQKLIEN